MSVPRFLILLGVILVIAGLAWPLLHKLGLGRLPGDIAVKRDGVQIYFPLMTSLIISLVLSLIIWLMRK